ncbi:osmotically inducible protein OsmC [bacterium]|nr:osmotically inducible protein OsmC [bacterium]|tara:strand:- start:635 stop:1045 length:411 start_codon:yes stop_codon:yes gene_type:complete
MTKIQAIYEGDLRCKAVHDLSNSEIFTDAPLDNCGKGESFSPTDLVAAALLTCMATIMGIAAKNSKIDICKFNMSVEKKMSKNLPRKISELLVVFKMKNKYSKKEKEILNNAALTCPVHRSLNESIDIQVDFEWVN